MQSAEDVQLWPNPVGRASKVAPLQSQDSQIPASLSFVGEANESAAVVDGELHAATQFKLATTPMISRVDKLEAAILARSG